jgi:hypothetical protein
MKGFVISDGKGYFVKRRRVDGRIIDLWSPRKKDAARFHFLYVAYAIAAAIPQHTVVQNG